MFLPDCASFACVKEVYLQIKVNVLDKLIKTWISLLFWFRTHSLVVLILFERLFLEWKNERRHVAPPSTFAFSHLVKRIFSDIPIICLYAVIQWMLQWGHKTFALAMQTVRTVRAKERCPYTLLSAIPKMEEDITASKGASYAHWTLCANNNLLDLSCARAFLSDFQMTFGKYSPSSHAYFIH